MSIWDRPTPQTPTQASPLFRTAEADRLHLLEQFYTNRRLAHEVLFKRRHPIKTPQFHHSIQDAFHSKTPQVVVEGFRDAAKSTVAEEAFVLGAAYKEFDFGVIVGASLPRAKERLGAVKNEFIVNDAINQLFGKMEGEIWHEQKIVLANGVCIMAVGAGQSMRGMRYLDNRPDFALIDDLEDEESVKTPEARTAMMQWLYRTFLPALKKGAAGETAYRVRFMGNRLDNDAVIVRIAKDKAWQHYKFPVMEQSDDGVERFDLPDGKWRPLWPEKFSIEDIAAKRMEYQRLGILQSWNCEYMCEADDPAAHIFKAGDARVITRVRTWQATYAAFDPARTVNSGSATTGIAVFSWINGKLVVWEGDAQLLLPNEIVDRIVKVDDEWQPVYLGVEATGLEEFIMQPLRQKMIDLGRLLPVEKLIPPQGKRTFIKGLQPFFQSKSIEFVNVSEEAQAQLLSFPTGRMDFPNALAYALKMKPGLPVYDIGPEHAAEEPGRGAGPWHLAVNATNQYTTAALIQLWDGQVRIHSDWVREGPPQEHLRDIVREARLDCGGHLTLCLNHSALSGQHDTVGLRAVARTVQTNFKIGSSEQTGRVELGRMLSTRRRENPLLVCSYNARWVLNALAGGYSYGVDRKGALEREAKDGPYRVLMEGVESFAAILATLDRNDYDPPRTAVGNDGRTYTTILARADAPQPAKDEWWNDRGAVNAPNTIRVVR